MDLIAVGDVMVDVHVRAPALKRGGDVHGHVRLHPAGTSANAAVWAASDGAGARVLGRVGDDLAGRLLRDALTERGVDAALTIDPVAPSGTMLVVVEAGERSMVADRGANARLTPDDLPVSLDAAAILVSGYLLLQEPTTSAGLAAIERGTATFIAVEASSWPLIEAFGAERFQSVTVDSGANVLLLNEREAGILVGRSGTDAARALGERYRVACVKLGEKGAAMSFDGSLIEVTPNAVTEVDATGAGDAFDGVLLAALARGADPWDALEERACLWQGGRSRRGGHVAGGSSVSALAVSEDVRAALADGGGAVGLETSVIGQGLPHPRNLECIERMSDAIRGAGAVPAWIGTVEGSLKVGLSREELERFAEPGIAVKVARRDLPMAVATGALGATTVSATIWAAHAAGIVVVATGGIGGVHPGDGDVSADLLELARTPVLLVCSGPKSIIDSGATVAKLEELGVALVGYGVDRLPWFLVREAPDVDLEHRVDAPSEAARLVAALTDIGAESAILLCNPIPETAAMDPDDVAAAAVEAEARAEREGVHGKARTPYLLAALAEITDSRSLEANLALLQDNARVAGEIVAAATSATRSG